jgi:hypothetical protein
MSDRLFLNLWFPSFAENEMMPRATSVARHFPFSQQRSGISYMAIHPVSSSEPIIFQQTFDVGADVDRVFHLASEFIHSDFAYEFEMFWDMWTTENVEYLETTWRLQPQRVVLTVHGTDFDDHLYQEAGHIQFELGLDSLFLYEDVELDEDGQARIKANVQKLVDFTQELEKNCGISGRVLWSESDEETNLAQKLIARLQRVQ